MPGVKICGLTDEAGLEAALAGGARYVGFVFHPASPRHAGDLARAGALAARARGRAKIVAVTVDPDDALLTALTAQLQPDYVQLHGGETPARVAEARKIASAGVIKALQIAGASDLDAAAAFEAVADFLLFDAKAPPGADRPGGHGAAFDWRILAGRSFARPWFLSGGLTSDNVAAATALSGARLVDVSSGVERGPGLKDPALIAAFLDAAKAPQAV